MYKRGKMDWKAVELQAVSVGTLIKLARDLAEPPGENMEYERAPGSRLE